MGTGEEVNREIISREEFESRTIVASKFMRADTELLEQALNVKVRAGHDYLWVHQTRWMGEPCLQLTTDLFAMSEIIFRFQPTIIIESGVAWGGTTLFLASALNSLGQGKVIGIDIFIPEDLKKRLMSKGQVSRRIELIEGSSVEEGTVSKVKNLISANDRVMVILDSHHTHDHVLRELNLYSEFVSCDQYLICGDTAIEKQPPAPLRPRPWGKGNNPYTALQEFLNNGGINRFRIDNEIDSKLLISNNWGGYLQRILN